MSDGSYPNKLPERAQAISLRKKGLSYKEILARVPVAKSTLSLWLRNIGLSQKQKQRLTAKKLAAAKRGAEAQRRKRRLITEKIKSDARAEVKDITKRELWLIGIMLYWAEGSKEKVGGNSVGIIFSNSDPAMIIIFKKWLNDICKVPNNNIKYELYIHINHAYRLAEILKYWANKLNLNIDGINVYYKKHKVITKRKNAGSNYFGLIRLKVRKSTNLNRKVAGWIEGLLARCGIV